VFAQSDDRFFRGVAHVVCVQAQSSDLFSELSETETETPINEIRILDTKEL
jgi:hypothetical protein